MIPHLPLLLPQSSRSLISGTLLHALAPVPPHTHVPPRCQCPSITLQPFSTVGPSCRASPTLWCLQELIKPDNQLQLTDTELAEEIAKMLVTTHPDLPKAGVRYALRERAWKPELATELTMMHYQADGWLVNRATDEGARLAKAAAEVASLAPSAEVSA